MPTSSIPEGYLCGENYHPEPLIHGFPTSDSYNLTCATKESNVIQIHCPMTFSHDSAYNNFGTQGLENQGSSLFQLLLGLLLLMQVRQME